MGVLSACIRLEVHENNAMILNNNNVTMESKKGNISCVIKKHASETK